MSHATWIADTGGIEAGTLFECANVNTLRTGYTYDDFFTHGEVYNATTGEWEVNDYEYSLGSFDEPISVDTDQTLWAWIRPDDLYDLDWLITLFGGGTSVVGTIKMVAIYESFDPSTIIRSELLALSQTTYNVRLRAHVGSNPNGDRLDARIINNPGQRGLWPIDVSGTIYGFAMYAETTGWVHEDYTPSDGDERILHVGRTPIGTGDITYVCTMTDPELDTTMR